MKKILLLFMLILPLYGYSTDPTPTDKSEALKTTLRDGKTYMLYFYVAGEDLFVDAGHDHYVYIEYKKKSANWWILVYPSKELKFAKWFFIELGLGSAVEHIKKGPFADSFFVKDDILEQRLLQCPQFRRISKP